MKCYRTVNFILTNAKHFQFICSSACSGIVNPPGTKKLPNDGTIYIGLEYIYYYFHVAIYCYLL